MRRYLRRLIVFVYRIGIRLFRGKGLHKIWPLGAFRDWLSIRSRTLGRPAQVTLRTHALYLDPEDHTELSVWGNRHPILQEIDVALTHIRKGDTVIDIGANIGVFTLFFREAVGSRGRVFAFEPGPENVAILRKNIKLSGYRNVTVLDKAVGENSGKLKLFLSDYSAGDHRIYDPAAVLDRMPQGAIYDKLAHKDGREHIEVSVVSLDDFASKIDGRINFVKIDVQGAEGGVLRGMRKILEHPLTILMEFWPAGLTMFGVSAEECLAILSETNFSFFEIEGGTTKAVTADYLLTRYTAANNLSGNILCIRENANRELDGLISS